MSEKKITQEAVAEYMAISSAYWQESDTAKLQALVKRKHEAANRLIGSQYITGFIDATVLLCRDVPLQTVCLMLRVLEVKFK